MCAEQGRSLLGSTLAIAFVLVASLQADLALSADDARTARARLVGSTIGTNAAFTAHTPQSVVSAAGSRCQLAPADVSGADLERQRKALQVELKRLNDEQAEEKKALRNRFDAGEMPHEEFRKQFSQDIPAKYRPAFKEWESKDAVLKQQENAQRAAAAGNLTIYLQHVPSDPNATIIPFEGNLPSGEFVQLLNRTLGPFLSTCPDGLQVSVLHYFRDEFPYGQAGLVGSAMFERPITGYRYRLERGALSLDAQNIDAAWIARYGPDPSRVVLSALRAKLQAQQEAREQQQKVHEEVAALERADYRKDYAFAAKRKPGIVYRYDPYWSKYRRFELARRIFDGDFSYGTESVHFKSVFVDYAIMYSERCKAHVKEFREFIEMVSEVVGTTDNPVTNLPENKYATRVIKTLIDARFADRYGGYGDAVKRAFIAKNLENLRKGQVPDYMNMTTGEARKLAKRVMDGDVEAAGIWAAEGVDGKFFLNHTCDSATVIQMGENILRAAAGRPSLQAEGVRHAKAEQESDPPTEKDSTPQATPSQVTQPSDAKSVRPAQPTGAVGLPSESSQTVQPQAPSTGAAPSPTGNKPVMNSTTDPASVPASTPAQVSKPDRPESPPQAESAKPSSAPSSVPPVSAPASKDDQAVDAKKRAVAMRELSQAHAKAMKEASQDFQAKMRSAKTQEERQVLQQEFRQFQQERQQALTRQLQELSGRQTP